MCKLKASLAVGSSAGCMYIQQKLEGASQGHSYGAIANIIVCTAYTYLGLQRSASKFNTSSGNESHSLVENRIGLLARHHGLSVLQIKEDLTVECGREDSYIEPKHTQGSHRMPLQNLKGGTNARPHGPIL